MFKCPNCNKKTVSLKDKVTSHFRYPGVCENCKKGYVLRGSLYFVILVIISPFLLLIDSNIKPIYLGVLVPVILLTIFAVRIFYPLKKFDLFE